MFLLGFFIRGTFTAMIIFIIIFTIIIIRIVFLIFKLRNV